MSFRVILEAVDYVSISNFESHDNDGPNKDICAVIKDLKMLCVGVLN